MAVFLCKAKDGAMDWGSDLNLARLRDWLTLNEGKQLRLERVEPLRSLLQNALYWAWLAKLEQESGNSSEDMHDYLKSRLLPKRIIKVKGKVEHELEVEGSTTKLTKAEFGEYLAKCAEHTEVPLPTPDEIREMGYISNQ